LIRVISEGISRFWMAATLPKPPMMTSARGFSARLTTVRATFSGV